MKRLFVGLRATVLATMLMPVSVRASGLAFDAAGNLYVADSSKHSVFKYTPDGTKNSFATELDYPLGLSFDGEGNLFVSDGAVTEASFLFTLKFDAKGNVKIVKMRRLSAKELEEEQ
jgi:sugar lactone lactonase YvrE